jgi:hypothetical protein
MFNNLPLKLSSAMKEQMKDVMGQILSPEAQERRKSPHLYWMSLNQLHVRSGQHRISEAREGAASRAAHFTECPERHLPRQSL